MIEKILNQAKYHLKNGIRTTIIAFFLTLIFFTIRQDLAFFNYLKIFILLQVILATIKFIFDLIEKQQIEKKIENYEKMLLKKNEKTNHDMNFLRLIRQRK